MKFLFCFFIFLPALIFAQKKDVTLGVDLNKNLYKSTKPVVKVFPKNFKSSEPSLKKPSKIKPNTNDEVVYSSIDNMPIKQLNATGYNMPISNASNDKKYTLLVKDFAVTIDSSIAEPKK